MKNNIYETYDQHFESLRNFINVSLDDYLGIDNPQLQPVGEAMAYSVEIGGKRVRPILTLEFCRMCGGNIIDAIPFACAIEMIHTYSLIHDDLPCMDDDDYRRGKESCHKKYGYANAVLAGDALLTYAFQIASDAGVNPSIALLAVRLLSEYAGIYGMIGGQNMDLQNEQTDDVKLDTIKFTHKLKTGALIRCACELGCTVAGASNKQILAAREYAENFGIAFQIVDDILDVVGTPEELGKKVGVDAENNKATYVTLLGIEEAKNLAKKHTEKALKALDAFEDNKFLKEATVNSLSRHK